MFDPTLDRRIEVENEEGRVAYVIVNQVADRDDLIALEIDSDDVQNLAIVTLNRRSIRELIEALNDLENNLLRSL